MQSFSLPVVADQHETTNRLGCFFTSEGASKKTFPESQLLQHQT